MKNNSFPTSFVSKKGTILIMKKYTLVHEEELLKTPQFKVVQTYHQTNDGIIRHIFVKSKPSVATIVLSDSNEIALIKKFRATTGKWYIELPADFIEPNETLLDGAIRIVKKETGLDITDVYQLNYGSNSLDQFESNENYVVAIGHTIEKNTQLSEEEAMQETVNEDIIWMPIEEAFKRLYWQMNENLPFMDNLYMSGHSVYSILVYKFLKC